MSQIHICRWSPTTQDILKTLKHGFVGTKLDPHEDSKVWLREDGKLVLERPEDLWQHHFTRRQENCHCGFFTVPWEPYRCLGGPLILDSNELLCKTFPSHFKNKIFNKKGTAPGHSFEHPSNIRERKDESTTCNSHSRTAVVGYSQIRELLKIEDERMVSLKAGLPYMDHIKQIKKRLEDKKEKPINGMVLMSTSDFAFMFGARESESADVDSKKSTEEKLRVAERSSSEESNPSTNSSATSSSTNRSSDSLLRVNSGLTERLDRMRKDNIEFLETLHRIITIMRNIKSKDLKSRQPLSRIQLREFEQSKRNDKDYKAPGVSQLQKRISTDTTFSTPTSHGSQSENRNPLLGPKRKNRFLSLFGVAGPLIAIGSRTSAMVNDRLSRMIVESKNSNRLETWEDLLRAGETQDGEHDLPVQIIADNMISKAIKWSRYISGKNISENISVIEEKNKPMWQIVANEKVKTSPFQDSQRNIKSTDPVFICQRVRRNLDKLNRSLQEDCNNEVKTINRNRTDVFRYKFSTFRDIDGTTLLERHLSRMREPRDYGSFQADTTDVIPSKWLDELTERIHNTVGADDSEVNAALGQLGQYAQMAVKNVPQTKARLCLIVMSLPAYDICKISTQLAVKFILEKIIQVPIDDIYTWLTFRKLPVVILK